MYGAGAKICGAGAKIHGAGAKMYGAGAKMYGAGAKTHLLFMVRLQRRSMIKYMVQRWGADW